MRHILSVLLITSFLLPSFALGQEAGSDEDVAGKITTELATLKDDASALEALASVFGQDAAIFAVFKMTLNYGDFITRLKSGDASEAMLVMIDAIEAFTNAGMDLGLAGITEYAGIAKGVGFISGAMTLGTWAGKKALVSVKKEIINRGYRTYKTYQADDMMMKIWWEGGTGPFVKEIWGAPTFWEKLFAGGAKKGAGNYTEKVDGELVTMGTLSEWVETFQKFVALENLSSQDQSADKKAVKKKAIMLYIAAKWPKAPAEELSNLILNNASDAEILAFVLQNIDRFKVVGDSSKALSADNFRQCVNRAKDRIFQNKISYGQFLEEVHCGKAIPQSLLDEQWKSDKKKELEDLLKFREQQREAVLASYKTSPFHDDIAAFRMFVQRKAEAVSELGLKYKKDYPGDQTGFWTKSIKELLGYSSESLFDNKPKNPFPGLASSFWHRTILRRGGPEVVVQYKDIKGSNEALKKFYSLYLPQFERLIDDAQAEQRYNSLVNYINNNTGILSYAYSVSEDLAGAGYKLRAEAALIFNRYKDLKTSIKTYTIDPIKEKLASIESVLASISNYEKEARTEYQNALRAYNILQDVKKLGKKAGSFSEKLGKELEIISETKAKYKGQEIDLQGDLTLYSTEKTIAFYEQVIGKQIPENFLVNYQDYLDSTNEEFNKADEELKKLGYYIPKLAYDSLSSFDSAMRQAVNFLAAYQEFLKMAKTNLPQLKQALAKDKEDVAKETQKQNKEPQKNTESQNLPSSNSVNDMLRQSALNKIPAFKEVKVQKRSWNNLDGAITLAKDQLISGQVEISWILGENVGKTYNDGQLVLQTFAEINAGKGWTRVDMKSSPYKFTPAVGSQTLSIRLVSTGSYGTVYSDSAKWPPLKLTYLESNSQNQVSQSSSLPSGSGSLPNEYESLLGFSFSKGGNVDMAQADFYWNDDGMPGTTEPAGMIDLGQKSLDSVASVPASGYKTYPDSFQPIVGHTYAVKTKTGKYGILEITNVGTMDIDFKWKYQSNGGNNF